MFVHHGYADIVVKDSQFLGHDEYDLWYWANGTASFDGVVVAENGNGLFAFPRSFAQEFRVSVRNSVVRDNDQGGVYAAVAPNAVLDLGTEDSPGNNVFQANWNSAGGANVRLNGQQDLRVTAVGNTWDPDLQGADAQGRYSVQGLQSCR